VPHLLPIIRGIHATLYATLLDANKVPDLQSLYEQRYANELTEAKIADDLALAESPAHGMDIFAYAADSTGAHDYRVLTMELLSKGFFE
jgi:cellulose biosynthesis protein BcsQ